MTTPYHIYIALDLLIYILLRNNILCGIVTYDNSKLRKKEDVTKEGRGGRHPRGPFALATAF
jgi:hypothetical protein